MAALRAAGARGRQRLRGSLFSYLWKRLSAPRPVIFVPLMSLNKEKLKGGAPSLGSSAAHGAVGVPRTIPCCPRAPAQLSGAGPDVQVRCGAEQITHNDGGGSCVCPHRETPLVGQDRTQAAIQIHDCKGFLLIIQDSNVFTILIKLRY